MGWLHAGHRSLIARSRSENATTVMTLFVNPKQFNNPDDLARIPGMRRGTWQLPRRKARPRVRARRRRGLSARIRDDGLGGRLATVLEGAARPGHFDGVATVVTILFNLVGADVAYFGQKDAQQVMVISRMARDLGIGTGSSPARRSGRLTGSRCPHATPCSPRIPRRCADCPPCALAGVERYQGGERSAEALRDTMWEVLSAEPLATPEYVSVASRRDARRARRRSTGRRCSRRRSVSARSA